MAHYLIQYILYRYIDENLIIDVTFFCSLHFIICIWRFHVQKLCELYNQKINAESETDTGSAS